MGFNRIVLHIDDSSSYQDRLAATLFVANKDGAVVTGVHTILRPEMPGYVASMLPKDIVEQNWQRAVAAAEARGEKFMRACEGAGVRGEWVLREGHIEPVLAEQGRTADFIVVSQPAEDTTYMGDDALVDELVMEAGRPVLMLPREHSQMGLGGNVALAWNGSRESARALADGLPWLKRAKRVDVVVVGHPGEEYERTGASVLEGRLEQLGVKATVSLVEGSPDHPGQALLGWLEQQQVNLLIMGAYGHSRLRELVLGGATAALVYHTRVPLLLSH